MLALKGIDCVALAADGQATGGQQGATRTVAMKLGDLHGRIAFGFAGSAGLRQRVVRNLTAVVSSAECGLDIADLRPKLHLAVNSVQHQAQNEQLTDLRGAAISGERNLIHALFAGVSDAGVPWIYEVCSDGGDEEHDIAEAIGSGRVYAMCALMGTRHHHLDKQKDEGAVLLAYRVMADAITIAAHDLGFPISMYIARQEGATPLSEPELDAVKRRMIEWQMEERDVFTHLAERRGLQPASEDSESVGLDPPPE